MVRGEYAKGVVLLLSFLVPARAIAVPTVSERDEAFVAYPLSAGSETYTHCTFESAQTIGLCTSGPAAISAKFHRSSVSFAGSPVPASGVKSLPSIPRATLMALTGFICVSLVRDRGFWLAALAGLVRTGQAGFADLPPLAWHGTGKKAIEKVFPAAVDCLCRRSPSPARFGPAGNFSIGVAAHWPFGLKLYIARLSFANLCLLLTEKREKGPKERLWHLRGRIRQMKRLLVGCAKAMSPVLEPASDTSASVSLNLSDGGGAGLVCALRRGLGLSKMPVPVCVGRLGGLHRPPERSKKCSLWVNSAAAQVLRR